jgi:hypothetical protein
MKIKANGVQPNRKRGTPANKFIDVSTSTNVTASGAILAGLLPVPQGDTVSDRTGDTVFLKELYLNYTVQVDPTDTFNSLRVIVFQWHPHSGNYPPTVTGVLQSPLIYSMYNWQISSNFTILSDRVHFLAGQASSVASSYNQGFFGPVSLAKTMKRAEFGPGSILGSNQLFILVISDSTVVPGPAFTKVSRVIYCED